MVRHSVEQALPLGVGRHWMVAELIKGILVGTLAPMISLTHHTPGCRVNIVGWSHRCVTRVSCREPYHSVDIFLNVLNQSFNHVDLGWAWANEHLNGVIDLFFVLTGAPEFQKLFLFSPLSCLLCNLGWASINLSAICSTNPWAVLHISVWHWDTMVSWIRVNVACKLLLLLKGWILLTLKSSWWLRMWIWESLGAFLFFLLSLLLFN